MGDMPVPCGIMGDMPVICWGIGRGMPVICGGIPVICGGMPVICGIAPIGGGGGAGGRATNEAWGCAPLLKPGAIPFIDVGWGCINPPVY